MSTDDPYDPYESFAKQVAWKAFLRATDLRERGDMDLDMIHIKTARRQFENWWDINHGR
jgi:hypothetical protein